MEAVLDASKEGRSRSKLQKTKYVFEFYSNSLSFSERLAFLASLLQQSHSDFSESLRNYRCNCNSISLPSIRSLKIFVILPLSKIQGLQRVIPVGVTLIRPCIYCENLTWASDQIVTFLICYCYRFDLRALIMWLSDILTKQRSQYLCFISSTKEVTVKTKNGVI